MKTLCKEFVILTLIVCCIVMTSCGAQTPANKRETDSTATQTVTETATQTVTETATQTTAAKETVWLVSEKRVYYTDSDVSTTFYEYDENGRCIFSYDDTEPRLESHFFYDERGNMIREERITNGEIVREITKDYNKQGWLIKEVVYAFEGSGVDKNKYTLGFQQFEYDKNGRITSVSDAYATDRYEYDEDGLLKAIVSTDSKGDPLSSHEYVYDDAGCVVKEIRSKPNEDPYTIIEMTYDENGNLETEIEMNKSQKSTMFTKYSYIEFEIP